MRDESSHCRDDIDEFKGGRTPLCVERAMDDGRDGYRSCSNGSIELKEVLDGTVSVSTVVHRPLDTQWRPTSLELVNIIPAVR